MKRLFFIISAIGFFTPFILFFTLQTPNENLKIFAIYTLPKFNLIYFALLIVFFFLGLKIKWIQFAQILFVSIYFAYLLVNYFILAPLHAKEFAKNYKNAKIVKLTELQKEHNFKIIFKEGNYAVIIPSKTSHTNPFNYIKDRGNY